MSSRLSVASILAESAQRYCRPQPHVFGAVALHCQNQSRDGILALYGFQRGSAPFANYVVRIIEHRPAKRLYASNASDLSKNPGGFVSQIGKLAVLKSAGDTVYCRLTQVGQSPCCFLAFEVVVACA